jgi:thiamine pyridinylase
MKALDARARSAPVRCILATLAAACAIALTSCSTPRPEPAAPESPGPRTGTATQPGGAGAQHEPVPRELRVALYPYVPANDALLLDIQQKFAAKNPGITLRFINLGNYYNSAKPDSLMQTSADVREVDSAFLYDLVEQQKIQPIPDELHESEGTFLPVAESASRIDGTLYGVPHWVCTNYLFALKDSALSRAGTLTDLRDALSPPRPAGGGLLIDLKGTTTLGELYIDALLDRHHDAARAAQHLTVATLDPAVLAALEATRRLCDDDLCRDEDYHDAPEAFYARLFAQGRGAALAGYSERLHYVQHTLANACRKPDGDPKTPDDCIDPSRIVAIPLPLAEQGSQPIAWVDMLTISKECVGPCLRDAVRFIRYVADLDTVRSALIPGWPLPPRYLLPARARLYSDEQLLEGAPLYTQLEPAVRDAIPVRGKDLVTNMRAIGEYLDAKLPK